MALNLSEHPVWSAQEHSGSRSGAIEAMPEILYVMGTGRSGTTILEVLLTNDIGITGTGEIKHIFRDGFVRDLPCACGKSGRQCKLWSAVLHASGWSQGDCVAMGAVVERLESHARFPLILVGAANRRALKLYKQASDGLFRSVAGITSSRVIVDSSKYPARALLLARMYPDKVKVLCITRSAAGLLAAFQKKNEDEQRPKSRLAAVTYYLYVLLCMRLVKMKLKERCFSIRFEDLNRNPSGTLEAIESWSGLSLPRARAKLAAAEWFDVGHIVTGNRLRKKGRVKFEPGSSSAAARDRITEKQMLAPMLEAYRKLMGF